MRSSIRISGLPVFIAILAATLGASPAAAIPLWYGGDLDREGAFLTGYDSVSPASRATQVFDDFVVASPSGWTVTSVYSNNIGDGITDAYGLARWEIRSGLASGSAGTLVASGSSAVTTTPTGRSFEFSDEYSLAVTGLNVYLDPGTYWVSVVPVYRMDLPGINAITTTSSFHGIGSPLDNGRAFVYSPQLHYNFVSFEDLYGPWDFSMGVDGVVGGSSPIPEPASLLLLGLGLAGSGGAALRRRRARRSMAG